ncbi:MAG: KH domain-containing protein [Coriobacteriia bacterium]|nr:KH domain-containing protein [Coriobacteriia bacterium]
MLKEHIANADTVEAATALALSELGVTEDEVLVQVLEEPGKRLFGGRKDAVVKVTVKEESSSARNQVIDEVIVGADLVQEETEAGEASLTRVQNDEAINEIVEAEELSDEQVDAIADAGIDHLKKLISYLTDGGISIEEFEGDEGEIILDVTGEDVGVLIGRHGRTIDALQAVVSAMTTKKTGIRYPLSVDVEGYKHRRKQKVVDIARRAVDRARRTNRPVSLKSMTPHERRIVHMFVKNMDDVTSTSEGSGSYRHVVIMPT